MSQKPIRWQNTDLRKRIAMILRSTGQVLGFPAIATIIDMIEAKLDPKSSYQLHPYVKDCQAFLFGMHAMDYVVFHGSNEWDCIERPGELFGMHVPEGKPLPPFNCLGYAELKSRVLGIRCPTIKEHNLELALPTNKLLIGGDRILPEVADIRGQFAGRLPYEFRQRSKLNERVLPDNPPDNIDRYYFDAATGRHYHRVSVTGGYLVDIRYSMEKPFGPIVSRDGRITRDVILITILPGIGGRVITIINPGYGAGSRMGDILTDGYILEELTKKIHDSKQGDPWLQAVFTCEVKHTNETELYSPPQLVRDSIVPLGKPRLI